jgi:hypothetical protein
MGDHKRNMKPKRKQKETGQMGSIQQTIFKPIFISAAQALNLKKDTLIFSRVTYRAIIG